MAILCHFHGRLLAKRPFLLSFPKGSSQESLPPVEEGILRFHFVADEAPLGLRFSGGSPPMILSVAPQSFSEKKGIPANHEAFCMGVVGGG